MIRRIFCVILAGMIFFGSACESNKGAVSGEVGMANPFVDCVSLEDGETLAGFSLNAPARVDGYGERIVRVIKNEMLELQYEGDTENAVIRKGKGLEDISGDYNVYEKMYKVKVFSEEVTMKGNGEKVDLAIWNFGEYSYSISIKDLTKEEMINVVKEVY